MTPQKYKRYTEIQKFIKELTEEKDLIAVEILEEIKNIPGYKLETDWGTFSVMRRPKYEYSEELSTKEKLTLEKFKIDKKREIEDGKAKLVSDGAFIRCQIS